MDKILGVALALAFVIITFLWLIFMPTPKCFFSMEQFSYQFSCLARPENYSKIQQEIDISQYDENGQQIIYTDGMPTEHAERYPYLYESLRTLPKVKKAFLQRVPKKFNTTQKRKGLHPYSNNTIRCVLPLITPSTRKSSIWVDGESKFFVESEWLFYDDSRNSTVCNKHKRQDLHLLVVDIMRPHSIPKGIAVDTESTLF